jgi:TM2 domain-containing membrane protein YozV
MEENAEEKVVVKEKVVVPKPPKSPFLAGLLSLFPGFGSLYNGEIMKGIAYMIIFALLVTVNAKNAAQPIAGLFLAGFIIYQLVDAVQSASRINRRALLGDQMEEEVDTFGVQMKSGSIFWGILLIVLGGILLLGNFEVISYKTIFDFWPLIVIIIGGKLILDYLSQNKKSD